MIVKNEERFLDDALRSVAGVVDEICIVDTGSTDRTREIALAHGARLRDVASGRRLLARAQRRARDGDAPLDLRARRGRAAQEKSRDALAAISSQLPGRPRKVDRLPQSHRQLQRLRGNDQRAGARLSNDPRIRYRNPIHEFIALDGSEAGLPADTTDIEIVHYGYLSPIVAERAKGERNLRLCRLAAKRDPDDAFHQYNLGMRAVGGRSGS